MNLKTKTKIYKQTRQEKHEKKANKILNIFAIDFDLIDMVMLEKSTRFLLDTLSNKEVKGILNKVNSSLSKSLAGEPKENLEMTKLMTYLLNDKLKNNIKEKHLEEEDLKTCMLNKIKEIRKLSQTKTCQ